MKKIIVYSLIFLLFLFGVFIAQEERLKSYAIDTLITMVEEKLNLKVESSKIIFSIFPLRIDIENLILRNQNRSVLALENLSVRLSLSNVWSDGLTIKFIKIDRATILASNSRSENHAYIFDWSHLPNKLKIKSLEIKHLEFAPDLLNLPPLYVSLSASFAPTTQEAGFELKVAQNAMLTKNTTFQCHVVQLEDNFLVNLNIDESDHGLLSQYLKLPLEYAYNLSSIATIQKEHLDTILNLQIPEGIKGDFLLNYKCQKTKNPILGSIGYLQGDYVFSKEVGLFCSIQEGTVENSHLHGKIQLSPNYFLDGTQISLMPDCEYLSSFSPLNITHMQIKMEAQGKLFSPELLFSLREANLSYENNFIDSLGGEGKYTCSENEQAGTFYLSGYYKNELFHLAATVGCLDAFLLRNLQFNLGHTHLIGNGSIDSKNSKLEFDLSGTLDWDLIGQRFPEIESTPISFQGHLESSNATSYANLSAAASSMMIHSLSTKNIKINVDCINPFNHPQTTLQVESQNTNYESWSLNSFSLETKIDSKAVVWPFSLHLNDPKNELWADCQGEWFSDLNSNVCNVGNFSGVAKKIEFTLEKPFYYKSDPVGYQFSPLHLSLGDSQIYVESELNFSKILLRATNLPLYLLNTFYGIEPMDGYATVIANLNKMPSGFVVGSAEMALNKVSTKHFKGLTSPFDGSMALELYEDHLKCEGSVTGISPIPITLNATLPINFTFTPPQVAVNTNSDINISLKIQTPLEPALELIMPSNGPAITGSTSINLDVFGSLASPSIKGDLHIFNGSFDLPGIGLAFRNIQADFNLVGTHAILKQLSGTDGYAGLVSGTGSIDLHPDRKFPFDCSVNIEKAFLRPSNQAEALASGNLKFWGDIDSGHVSGNITSEQVDIVIPEQTSEQLQAIEVTYVNQPVDLPAPTIYKRTPSSWPLHLDLHLDVPDKGFIRGKDWSSEWEGHVNLLGTTDSPLYYGNCQIIKGAYDFNGKIFEIKEGTINFAGEHEKKTMLYVIASRQLDALTAEVILRGPIRNPAISFRSDPPLSQREIISWLLFNQGTDQITPFQGTQLNQSITNLNMDSSQPDMLTRLRTSFGVDRLDINRSARSPNEVSIQVGKYISRGVLVSVSKSVSAEANQLAIEADLVNNVKVQAQVGDDAEAQLLLKWRKNY